MDQLNIDNFTGQSQNNGFSKMLSFQLNVILTVVTGSALIPNSPQVLCLKYWVR